MATLGLYLHIPFCRSKCLYCDFCSFPNRDEEQFSSYTKALCRDLEARAAMCADYTVDTVYIGGGTPTVLPARLLVRILECVRSRYRLTEDAEITVECNPVTENRELFRALYDAGVNRLSVGVQSMHTGELRSLGRLHTPKEVAATFADARAVGFTNLSADVMFGIPNQTPQSWAETLRAVCALEPTHLSAYGLIVEEGTPFFRMGERLVLPDEETTRTMYFEGAERLEHMGYRQYEISNFARTGYESRHNLKYWSCEEYLGFGPAAYSDFGGRRFGNSRALESYLAGSDITEESETPSLSDRKNEYVMLRMRLSDGISANAYGARFHADLEADFGHALSRYAAGGFVQKKADGYAFTREGMYVSNAILSDILSFEN